jgi:signal transduction histidine kinase
VVLAVAAIVPTLIIGGLSIYRARADVETEVVRGRLAHVRALASSLDQTLQGARRSLELAAAWWADERSVTELDSPESQRVMDRLWRRLHREVPIFTHLSILDLEGRTIYGEPLPVDPQLGAHSFGGFIGDVVFDDGAPYVPVVTQARSRTGERIGVLVARLDLGFVAETIADARLGTNAVLYVLDGQGHAIARSDGVPIDGDAPSTLTGEVISQALGRLSEGKIFENGTLSIYRNLVAFQNRRAVSWALVLSQPERNAFALARKTARDTVVVAIIVLAVALLAGAALASRLTRPLHLLARRARSIAEGQVDDEGGASPVDAPGELGQLALRIEEMAKKIGERERLQAALAHEDRLATVGTMAASVAHEVNNPLTTILGYSSFLLEDKSEDDPDRSSLTLIADEAARMKAIVGNMLDYARVDSRGSGAADVNRVLERVAALMVPAFKKSRVTVTMELEPELPPAQAGEQPLQQVFVNLVQNAGQAMSDGGEVRVISQRVAKGIMVCVDDEGPGIPEDMRARVFDAFYTTKEAGKGTGLGLAVVKHLVTEFRGTIEVEGIENDRGTRMKVVIPIHEAPDSSTTENDEAPDPTA